MFSLPACQPLASQFPIIRAKNNCSAMHAQPTNHACPVNMTREAGKGRQRGRAAGRQEYLEFPAADCAKTGQKAS